MKKYFFITVLFVFILSGLAYAGEFKIIRVIDGDSVVAAGFDVEFKARLIGIDCPEIGQPYALEAKSFLEDTILNKVVDVQGFGYGFYNRPLVLVFINGKNVNLELIKVGYAEAYRKYKAPKGFDRGPYIEAEEVAKDKCVGIWSLKNYTSPSEYRRMHRH